MTVKRMDNVGIVVEDLDAAIGFFTELGLELEGRAPIEGAWADGVTGLTDLRVEIAMMRTPDGHSRLELSRFLAPPLAADHRNAPVNALGLGRVKSWGSLPLVPRRLARPLLYFIASSLLPARHASLPPRLYFSRLPQTVACLLRASDSPQSLALTFSRECWKPELHTRSHCHARAAPQSLNALIWGVQSLPGRPSHRGRSAGPAHQDKALPGSALRPSRTRHSTNPRSPRPRIPGRPRSPP
jgi:catechol 2,3-dioxygenase-like lactoylglutathione lyase family enzyme